MKTKVDSRLCEEVSRYQLRFGCEDCAHFSTTDGQCANGYPNRAHHQVRCEPGSELEFCKQFELV